LTVVNLDLSSCHSKGSQDFQLPICAPAAKVSLTGLDEFKGEDQAGIIGGVVHLGPAGLPTTASPDRCVANLTSHPGKPGRETQILGAG
jgi:hypothetical protein